MTQLALELNKTQEEKLLAIGKQFYTELERKSTPFPNPATLQALKQALTEALQAQENFEATWLTGELHHNLPPLQIIHPSTEVRNLPWQLALEGNRAQPLVKSKEAQLPPHTASQSYPLKVLIMVAAPAGVADLKYEEEELKLLTAFSPLMSKGLVEVHFTEDGSLENLEENLLENKYHILHFSGHGSFDEEKQVGQLALEEPLTGKLHLATAKELNEVFKKAYQKGHRPDMVLLSACQTAQGTTGDVTGVADTLLEGGIPAVLAMSASILDNCASFFAAELYKRIADGFALPYAFQQSCWALRAFEITAFGNLMQQAKLVAGQWLIPQLLMSQAVEHLVDKNAPRTELDFSKSLSVVQGDEGLLELRVRPKNYVFVGRRKEKSAAFNALKAGKSVLLRGQGGVGKTALAEHLAIRLLVRNPRTKVFTHSEKAPAADSLLQQMTTYLTKEHKQFKVVSQLAVIEKLQDKFLYLLGEVAQYCEPLFIFDNVESFQSYEEAKAVWVWNINQHEDVFTLLQLLDQYSDFPMLVTGRYELAEFPDWERVNMNSAPFGDFFKKCTQLKFYEITKQLQSEKAPEPFKNAEQKSANFEQVVRLLYDTLGGNYRALEFFDEAYQKDKAGIFKLLQELANLKESKAAGEVLHRMSENLVFEQLLAYLDAQARDVLSLLTRFNIPVLPMAIGFQREGLNPIAALQKLTQLTLAEEQAGSDGRSRYYVIPLVKELLKQVQFKETSFDALQAGAYHEYVLNEKLGLDALSEISEAFEFYCQEKTIEYVNKLGNKLCDFYYDIQQFRLALSYGLRIEKVSKESTSPNILNTIGTMLHILGKSDKALHYLESALETQLSVNNLLDKGAILNNIALIYQQKGEYVKALKYLQEDLIICQNAKNRKGEGVALNNIGQIYLEKGDQNKALEYFKSSLKIRYDIGDQRGKSSVLNNISQIYHDKRDLNNALDCLKQSLKIARDSDDYKGEGIALSNIAQVYIDKRDSESALDYLTQSLKIIRNIGSRRDEGVILNNLAIIFQKQGDYDSSLTYLERSLKITREIGDFKGKGATLTNIGQIYMLKRDFTTAKYYLEQSLKIRQEIGLNYGLAETLYNLGVVSIQLKHYEYALPCLLQAHQIWENTNSLNAESSVKYIAIIIEKIGKERAYKITQQFLIQEV